MAGATVPRARATGPAPLRALVVDGEAPARELAWLLRRDPRIGQVRTARSAPEALLALDQEAVDVVFCDVTMPGLDGLDLGRVLSRTAGRPHVVVVGANDEHALDCFGQRVVDQLRKPVRPERLAEAVRRVVQGVGSGPEASPEPDDEIIPVELAGVTRFVQRSQVRYVEAQGDYARLYTASSSHLVRIPLTALEERWADAGFVRIHRSTLIALQHVDEIRIDGGRCCLRLGDRVLQVSRRHMKELRDRLVGAASVSAPCAGLTRGAVKGRPGLRSAAPR